MEKQDYETPELKIILLPNGNILCGSSDDELPEEEDQTPIDPIL